MHRMLVETLKETNIGQIIYLKILYIIIHLRQENKSVGRCQSKLDPGWASSLRETLAN